MLIILKSRWSRETRRGMKYYLDNDHWAIRTSTKHSLQQIDFISSSVIEESGSPVKHYDCQNEAMVSKKILLWTAPRCVSTAFERSIMTLSNTKVFHEPYSSVFYFGPERQSLRYASTPIDPRESYSNVGKKLNKEYDGIDVIFSKDMAYCVENNFKIFLDEQFQNFQHTFLIRDPAKAISSLYQASTNPKLTGWDYFDSEEAGFRQMYELYEFVTENIHPNPVVVDADDLLEYPDETMKSYCDAVGIAYESHMTSWEPGPVPEWDIWSGWHENALKSSGFTPKSAKKPKAKEAVDVPPEVLKIVEDSRYHYDYLATRKIRPMSTMKSA